MYRVKLLLLSVVFLAVPSLCAGQGEDFDRQARDAFDKSMYGKYLSPVTSFGYIYVNRFHSGVEKPRGKGISASEIDNEMTDFVQLRFKNNFASIPYKFVDPLEWSSNPTIGHIQCMTWLHGAAYPIAYHIECNLGAGKKSKMLHEATLGVTSPDRANGDIRAALDRMVSTIALRFFRARGEM